MSKLPVILPKVVHEISDPRLLSERVPRYGERFDAIVDVRNANEALFGAGRDANIAGMRCIASIPEAVLSRIIDVEPDFLLDKKKLHAWLNSHPEYRTIRKKGEVE